MNFSELKKQTLGITKEKRLSTFFVALLTAAVFFVPFIVMNEGYFLFYGDFNVQQIPFYKHCHEMLRSGNFAWDWGTDLGVNFIGSYSFYTIGSPFFWLTLPFPTDWVPYFIGPLLILKFACSALSGYLYIRRFTRTPDAARIGGLLYAFSGFAVYNIFFNHFHEAIVFFPLLLLSVELLITENRRGFFAAMVAITAISNYFFFFGMVVFTVIYWFVRVFSGCYKMTFGRFAWFAFEAVLGLLISAALLVPTCYAVLGNSRITEILHGWGAITYGKEQIYLNIIECFFFPPDIPARPVFFPDADVKWSSLGGWLPLFSMVGVFAWMQQKKGTWQRRMLGILMFMAMVPILNSAFYMFNNAYYARWYYMPVLLMAMVTAQCIEDTEIHWKSPYKWVTGITVATVLVFAFFPREIEDGKITKWGLYVQSDDFYLYRFLATAAIAVVSLIILGMLLRMIKTQRKQFMKSATALICAISIIYAGFFIICGRSHSYDYDIVIDDLIEADIELDGDKDTFRIDVFEGIDNTGMFLGYQTINAFHSVVPTSVTEFWEYIGEERGVASRPTTESFAARSLLGVKYLLAREDGDSFTDDMGEPQIPGFEFYSHENGYDVYLNQNFVSMGFAYDYYMTEAQCGNIDEKSRANAMLKAILLTDEQVGKYGGLLTNISDYGKENSGINADDTTADSTDTDTLLSTDTTSDSLADSSSDMALSSGDIAIESNSSDAESLQSSSDESYTSYESEVTDFGTDEILDDYNDYRYSDALLNFFYDNEELALDTKALKEKSVFDFHKTDNGFGASINLEKDNLVFFSVPYDEGWSATVNGKSVEVEKVNAGFMAVPVKAGESVIEFTYTTPGMKLGVIITLLSLFVWLFYTVISLVLNKKGMLATTEYPEGYKLIEKFQRDAAKDIMMENVGAETEERPFDIEITDDSVIYGYDEQTSDFNRGFWINTDIESEDDSIPLSDISDNPESDTNENNEEE